VFAASENSVSAQPLDKGFATSGDLQGIGAEGLSVQTWLGARVGEIQSGREVEIEAHQCECGPHQFGEPFHTVRAASGENARARQWRQKCLKRIDTSAFLGDSQERCGLARPGDPAKQLRCLPGGAQRSGQQEDSTRLERLQHLLQGRRPAMVVQSDDEQLAEETGV
jgi:hypothetical protein